MTEPPPMPNRPARSPVITPPMTMAAASQRISFSPTPRSIFAVLPRSGSDVRQFAVAVRDETDRFDQKFGAGMRRRRGTSEMPAESTRPRHGAEQAMQMPGDGVEPPALLELARDIGKQRRRGLFRRSKARGFGKEQRIDG